MWLGLGSVLDDGYKRDKYKYYIKTLNTYRCMSSPSSLTSVKLCCVPDGFRVASGEISQLSCCFSRRPAAFWSIPRNSEYTEFSEANKNKNCCAVKRFIFFVFVPSW